MSWIVLERSLEKLKYCLFLSRSIALVTIYYYNFITILHFTITILLQSYILLLQFAFL